MTDENGKCGCSSNTTQILTTLTVLAMIGLLYMNLARPAAGPQTIEVTQPDYQRNTLTVTGSAQLTVTPDEALAYISIVSDNLTARFAQENDRKVADAVMAALKAQGINSSDIETDTYQLSRLEDWQVKVDPADPDADKGKYVDRGYRLTHTIKATIRDVGKVGDVIDASIGAGANGIDSVTFDLTKESEKRVKADAMVQAVEAAGDKAESLAKTAGATLGKVITINEQNFYYTPYVYNTRSNVMVGAAGAAPPTAISPQKVEVSSSVMLVYGIG